MQPIDSSFPPRWNSPTTHLLPLVKFLKPLLATIKPQVATRVEKRRAAMERRTKKGIKSGQFKGLTLGQLFATSTAEGGTFLERQARLYERYS